MLLSQRQQQQQWHAEEGGHSRSTHEYQETSMATQPQFRPPVRNAVLSSGMQLALALTLLINWLLRKRMSLRQTRVAAAAGLSAGARLLRLELLAGRQSQALLAAERQITKLNTRARLLGKDLQPPLRQVQAENIQQAETLVKLVEKVEGLNTEVQDTQQLIGALHGATAKQLQLVMQALTLAQAAKALALSASAAPAVARRSPATSNGAPAAQVPGSRVRS
ncbi:g2204 [Coccomyxa viridis]|uniref:G2204 protein n=1 Tax=Coccomyxa viridis TaxID=1274662 RepID=A0ABP1FQ11_9CHLO